MLSSRLSPPGGAGGLEDTWDRHLHEHGDMQQLPYLGTRHMFAAVCWEWGWGGLCCFGVRNRDTVSTGRCKGADGSAPAGLWAIPGTDGGTCHFRWLCSLAGANVVPRGCSLTWEVRVHSDSPVGSRRAQPAFVDNPIDGQNTHFSLEGRAAGEVGGAPRLHPAHSTPTIPARVGSVGF